MEKTTKTLALALAIIFISLTALHNAKPSLALSNTSPCYTRITYQFIHANILHAIINSWCLLALVFKNNLSFTQLTTAFIIAAAIPAPLISHTPIVGASGICFASIGIITLKVKRKLLIFTYTMAVIAAGSIFSKAAVTLHLYCYITGIITAIFTTPVNIIKGKANG